MSKVKSVVVRMYRGLLGDCFLLRIAAADGSKTHILVDCGILQGLKEAAERMVTIAEDIEETCGGVLDLVVVTHQHHDHISGFSHAKHILLDPERVKIRELWMAWTEDPRDADATRLREQFSGRKLAVAKLALALGAAATDGLEKFIGPVEPGAPAFGAAPTGRLTGDRIMEELKRVAEHVRYLSPGSVVEVPGELGLPVAVLAPPRATSRLFKDLPSSGTNKETYLQEELFAYSLLGASGDTPGGGKADLATPFSPRFSTDQGLPADKAAIAEWGKQDGTTGRWIHDHYYLKKDEREGELQDYRRIDSEWSRISSALALKLDSDTNNTSLVLAFKLPDGDFLLFAADAQVGNWLSWHDQDYEIGGQRLTAEQILGRTTLYKVGHHASHNATLRARGLELMKHPKLAAMISTVEETAEAQGRPPGWQMPDDEVKAALLERCHGRLLRGDRNWASDRDTAPFRKGETEFAARLDDGAELFMELTMFSNPAARRDPKKRSAKMDHVFDLNETRQYVARLDLPAAKGLGGAAEDMAFETAKQQALLVGSDVMSFDVGVEAEFREAVSASALLAQLAATKQLGLGADPIAYFDAYFAVLGKLGWVTQVRDTATYKIATDGAKVHKAIIEVVTAFIGNIPAAAALVALTLKQLQAMDENSPLITLFYRESENAKVGRFQFTTVRQDAQGGLFAEVMAFALSADRKITKILFFELNKTKTKLRRSLGTMSLNRPALQALLPTLRMRVQEHLADNLAKLEI